MRRLALGLLLALAACAEPPSLPRSPVAAGPDIAVRAQPVPLDESDPGRDRIGRFAWAGGVWLTSSDTSRLHGLSDIKVDPKGALIAESDEGDLLRARVTLGPDGKLTGLAGARMTALTGEDGKPPQTKAEADSEGIALFPNGDLLVSFEEHDRILLYPARGGPPHAAPSPDVR